MVEARVLRPDLYITGKVGSDGGVIFSMVARYFQSTLDLSGLPTCSRAQRRCATARSYLAWPELSRDESVSMAVATVDYAHAVVWQGEKGCQERATGS